MPFARKFWATVAVVFGILLLIYGSIVYVVVHFLRKVW
jgi:hypothetical protein